MVHTLQPGSGLVSVYIPPFLVFGDGRTPSGISQEMVTRCLPAISEQHASRFKSGVGGGDKICFHDRTNKSPGIDLLCSIGKIWIIRSMSTGLGSMDGLGVTVYPSPTMRPRMRGRC